MPVYVGLDVHKRTCHATVVDEQGKILVQEKFKNEPRELERFFKGIDDAKVAMEASYCWQPTYELLESMGYEVKLAHPKRTRAVAEAKIKTDAKDSEVLAYLLELDWLPTAYVPVQDIRDLRELVRLRTCLVQEQTRFNNKVRAELAKHGVQVSRNPFSRRGREELGRLNVRTVNDCLEVLETLAQRIRELERELRSKAGESREAELLMSIPGVGYFSALAILAEIGDINRFPNPEKLCAYAGIVPSVEQSENTRRLDGTTKEGSALLRWVLIQCAWMHLYHTEDTRLTRFFWKVSRRKGRKVAIVAMARKMLVAIYWMLRRGERFRA